MSEPVGVVGVGWVGLVTAACFSSQGHEVWAMDVDEAKIAKLSAGEVTFHEPGLGELVAEHAARLHFTTDMDELLANTRLLFCCVDTPPTYSGDADLSRVRAVVERLPEDAEHALVMKSTVPSGTGASIRREMPGLAYVSCPEFLKEGSAVEDFLNPDRVVIGADEGDEASADAVAALYEPLGGEIVRTDVASAEMIKLASNAFLATKISFINEIANVCEEVGADVTEVARGMGLDERIGGAFLKAGIGYGGSCFPKDVSALKQLAGNSGYHFQLLNSVIEVNELQKRRVIGKLTSTWARSSASGSPCSASRSSRTPTTCARRRAWCCRRACRARGRTWSPTTRSRPRPPRACWPRPSSRPAPPMRWRARTARSSSPSGPSSPISTGRSWRGRCAARC